MRQIRPEEHQQLQSEFLAALGSTPSHAPIEDRHRPEDPFETSRQEIAGQHLPGASLKDQARRAAGFYVILLGLALWWAGILLFPLVAYIRISGWPAEGSVNLPTSGAPLNLAGVPGDEIRLRLFEADSSPDSDKSSAYLQVTDTESGFQTTLFARFEAGDPNDAGIRPVYARIPVPGAPGKQAANLSGHFWGQVVFESSDARSVEVPVNLRLVQRGDAEANTYTDTAGVDPLVLVVFALVGVLATGAMTAQRYADWLEGKLDDDLGPWFSAKAVPTETKGELQ
jgi:hypothetical protein